METPKSPPPQSSISSSPKPANSDDDIQMVDADNTPATISFEHHPRNILPPAISSAYPNGIPARDLQQDAAFQSQKNEILRTMTGQEMEKRYKELAGEIVERLEEDERKEVELKEEMEKLTKSRELEIKVYERLKAEKKD